MAHRSTTINPISLAEFRLRVAACAESAKSILDELESLLRQLVGSGQIKLADGERRIPFALRAFLGAARTSLFEAWSLLSTAATREESEDDGFQIAVEKAKAVFRTPDESRPGCCPAWELGSSYLLWRRSADHSGLLLQPSIIGGDGLLLPVLKCPFCGKDAPQAVTSDQLGRSQLEHRKGSLDRLGAAAEALYATKPQSEAES